MGIPRVQGDNIRKTLIGKLDMRRLQVLQNKVLSMKTRMPYGTTTSNLLAKANDLSVHQLIAYYSMTQVYKVISSSSPSTTTRDL